MFSDKRDFWRDLEYTFLDEGPVDFAIKFAREWHANLNQPWMQHQREHAEADINESPDRLAVSKAAEFIFSIEQGLPLDKVRPFSLTADPGWDAELLGQRLTADVKGSNLDYKYLFISRAKKLDSIRASILVLTGVKAQWEDRAKLKPIYPWWGLSKGWLSAVEFKRDAQKANYAKNIGGRTLEGKPHLLDGTHFIEQEKLHKMHELRELIDLEEALL